MPTSVLPESQRSPHIVVIGAGFGGIAVARALPKDANVTIVDQHNYQTFLPLLYQVASSGLAADQIAYPVRGALRGTSANFRLGTAQGVDAANQVVKLADGTDLHYDHLILAAGSVTNDYGVSGVSEFAFGMKSLKEALTIRATFLRRFEELASAIDDGRKVEPLSVVVIGAHFHEKVHVMKSYGGVYAIRLTVENVGNSAGSESCVVGVRAHGYGKVNGEVPWMRKATAHSGLVQPGKRKTVTIRTDPWEWKALDVVELGDCSSS